MADELIQPTFPIELDRRSSSAAPASWLPYRSDCHLCRASVMHAAHQLDLGMAIPEPTLEERLARIEQKLDELTRLILQRLR